MRADETVKAIEETVLARGSKKLGAEIFFLCPSHDDHNPSARWNVAKRVWFCDACKAGGGYVNLALVLGIERPRPWKGNPVLDSYVYTDESGQPSYKVDRTASKKFPQSRADGSGGWTSGLKGVARTLFRLPELLAANPEHWVFIPAGEKDVNRLVLLGLVATCNSGGEGKWTNDLNHHLAGRHVVVLEDNDERGRSHVISVAESLTGMATSLRVLRFPDLPEKGDVSDWLNAGGTAEELITLAEEADEYEATSETTGSPLAAPGTIEPFARTDLGNGERFAAQHGATALFVHSWNKWLVYDGTRYVPDATGGVQQLAKETVRSISQSAADETDSERREQLARWAAMSESDARIKAMMSRAESELAVTPEELDTDPWLLNVANGTLDLRAGTLREHSQSDRITKLAPVDWDASAEAPMWEAFLATVLPDEGTRDFMRRLVGYGLTGVIREHIIAFLYGMGANGKSTFLETVRGMLGDRGDGYAQTAPADLLMAKSFGGSGVPNDVARLQGVRFLVASELDEGRRLSEAFVKSLTSGDRLSARYMRGEFFEFEPTAKVVVATNHLPGIRGTDAAIWRRIRLVPFNVTIPDEEQDLELGEKLRGELSGILNWAVAGCREWQEDGLGEPKAVTEATFSFRAESDTVGEFIREKCVEGATKDAGAESLFGAYKQWMEEAGEKPLSRPGLKRTLEERGFTQVRRGSGQHWTGIGLIAPERS